MRIENLGHLSKRDIETKSIRVLEHFNEHHFHILRATPIIEIVLNLESKNKLKFDHSSFLGFDSTDRTRIRGCYVPSCRAILIDSSLYNEAEKARYHFVLAHELGHFVLHRKTIFSDQEDEKISSSDACISSQKRELKSPLDWIEWQANYFASSIMLPKIMVSNKLRTVQESIGLRATGKIYVDNQKCTQNDYHEILHQLSDYFLVSRTVVEIRLKDLEIVDDQRGFDRNHIGSILKDVLKGIKEPVKPQKYL